MKFFLYGNSFLFLLVDRMRKRLAISISGKLTHQESCTYAVLRIKSSGKSTISCFRNICEILLPKKNIYIYYQGP